MPSFNSISALAVLIVKLGLTPADAQSRQIRGTVLDSLSLVPLQNVSVTVPGSGKGILTDAAGKFIIQTEKKSLRFTATGYKTKIIPVADTPMRVLLSVSYVTMQDIVISKKKYRNKNNPAVELIRQVIAHKDQNAPEGYPYMTYEQYDKIRVLADRPPRFIVDNALLKKYRFLFDPPDTITVPGKALVPGYMEEVASRIYYRSHPVQHKQVILGRKRVDLGEYIDMGGISAIMNRLYEDFSVYDNTMLVFTLQFMSPVAKLAPEFYMYFIRDTVEVSGVRVIRLYFTPRNPEDLLFRGTLYITLDGRFAIRKAEMEASPHGNLNWVRSFRVTQEFEVGPGDRYYRSSSDMLSYFSLVKNNLGFYGEHTTLVSDVSDTSLGEDTFRGLPVDTTLQSVPQPDSFWMAERPHPLSPSEARTYANTDSLLKMRSYHRLMDIITLLTVGYKSAGKFDVGPVGSFYSFNTLEGSRYQFGGRSNAKLSKRIFTDDYVAYGTDDRRWKYKASATWSINHKSIYTYPFHYVQASYLHDVRNPGEENEFAQENSFLGSFNRGVGGKWLYTDIATLTYIREFGDHFSYNLAMKYWSQQPAQSLVYVYEPQPAQFDTVRQLTTTQFSVTLGWAPHQQFYQGKTIRRTITTKYPILTLQYSLGIKGLLGGQYYYNAFHLAVSKRWYVSPLGYSDISLDAGYITGNLPFPLLIIHPANTAFYYSFSSYNLMNVEEFVSDHYVGLDIDHYFNGFFFNKIPLLKKLRLRELVEGKLLFGGVRPENNPALNPDQMKFPLNNGVLSTYVLGNQPYFEAGVGVYNILNLFRVDLIHRFTYLDHPDIPTYVIRFSTRLDF